MNDLRTLLHDFRADEAPVDELALARARATLVRRTVQTARPVRRAHLRPVARVGVVLTAAASLTGGFLLLPGLLPNPPSATAVELLDRAASVAGRAAPEPVPGQVFYSHVVSTQVNSPMSGDLPVFTEHAGHVCFSVAERWNTVGDPGAAVGRNLDGVTRASAGAPARAPEWDPACARSDMTFEPEALVGDGATWQAPDEDFVATLPTEPEALHDRARADAAELGYENADAGTFTLLIDHAGSDSPAVRPALRAAVFRAIALVPGVEDLGTTTTLTGAAASVIGRVGPDGERTELLIDPTAGAVLGKRQVATDDEVPGVPAGTAYYESAVRVSVVGATGERPAG